VILGFHKRWSSKCIGCWSIFATKDTVSSLFGFIAKTDMDNNGPFNIFLRLSYLPLVIYFDYQFFMYFLVSKCDHSVYLPSLV